MTDSPCDPRLEPLLRTHGVRTPQDAYDLVPYPIMVHGDSHPRRLEGPPRFAYPGDGRAVGVCI